MILSSHFIDHQSVPFQALQSVLSYCHCGFDEILYMRTLNVLRRLVHMVVAAYLLGTEVMTSKTEHGEQSLPPKSYRLPGKQERGLALTADQRVVLRLSQNGPVPRADSDSYGAHLSLIHI